MKRSFWLYLCLYIIMKYREYEGKREEKGKEKRKGDGRKSESFDGIPESQVE